MPKHLIVTHNLNLVPPAYTKDYMHYWHYWANHGDACSFTSRLSSLAVLPRNTYNYITVFGCLPDLSNREVQDLACRLDRQAASSSVLVLYTGEDRTPTAIRLATHLAVISRVITHNQKGSMLRNANLVDIQLPSLEVSPLCENITLLSQALQPKDSTLKYRIARLTSRRLEAELQWFRRTLETKNPDMERDVLDICSSVEHVTVQRDSEPSRYTIRAIDGRYIDTYSKLSDAAQFCTDMGWLIQQDYYVPATEIEKGEGPKTSLL